MRADLSLARRIGVLVHERAPVPAMLAIGLVQLIAASYLVHATISWSAVVLGSVGVGMLLIELRLMDEVKDLAKDRLAHPERPLPRGLLTIGEARRAVRLLGAAMLAYAVPVTLLRGATAGALYAAAVAYAYLMYREFFAPRALARNAFVYAISHQVILFPLFLFAGAVAAPGAALTTRTHWFAVAGVGAGFMFELARKLDPRAHPALGTYLLRHGRTTTYAAMLAALGVLAAGAAGAGTIAFVLPFVALVLATLTVAWVQPMRHKWVARAAAALVLALLLAPTIQHFVSTNP